MSAAFLSGVMLLAVIWDLLLGSFAFPPAAVFFCSTYFYLASFRRGAMTAAVICGLGFDLLFGRGWFTETMLMLFVMFAADRVVSQSESRQIFDAVLPGSLTGAILPAGNALAAIGTGTFPGVWNLLFQVLFSTLAGGILFPFLVLILDGAANMLGLSSFCRRNRSRSSLHHFNLTTYQDNVRSRSRES